MENTAMNSVWSLYKKVGFRILFLFVFITSLFVYNPILSFLGSFIKKDIEGNFFEFFKPFAIWFDKYVTHLGFGADSVAFFGDFMYGWILLTAIFIVSIVGTLVWSLLDKRRASYNQLLYFFRIYLCYFIFQAMIIYAVEKIIPVQMPYPNAVNLYTPLKDLGMFGLIWNFIGASPAYSFITGSVELLACLLIIFRRTRGFGSLLMLMVTMQVCILNFTYGIPVKLPSSFLVLCSLIILSDYLPNMYRFFIKQEAVNLNHGLYSYTFSTKWIYLLWLFPAYMVYHHAKLSIGYYNKTVEAHQQERVFEVEQFVKGSDTLAPLLTDTFRFKKLIFTNYHASKYAVFLGMNDIADQYQYKIDSKQKLITLNDFGDTINKIRLTYFDSTSQGMTIKGIWKKSPMQFVCKKVEVDSFNLVSEKFKLIRDSW
jgi:hypothetical protein